MPEKANYRINDGTWVFPDLKNGVELRVSPKRVASWDKRFFFADCEGVKTDSHKLAAVSKLVDLKDRREFDSAASKFLQNGSSHGAWQDLLDMAGLVIEADITRAREVLTPKSTRLKRAADMEDPGPLEYLLEGLILIGKVTSLFGDGATGKSSLALHLIMACLAGQEFLGIECRTVRAALYLDFEEDWEEFSRRVHAVARGYGVPVPPGLMYMSAREPLEEILLQIKALVGDHDVGLIVVDSIGTASDGDIELSKDAKRIMQALSSLGTTVLAIDHEPKLQGSRQQSSREKVTQYGSGFKRFLSRSQIHVVKQGDSGEGSLSLVLHHEKLNSGPLQDRIPAYLKFREAAVFLELGDHGDAAFQSTLTAEHKIVRALMDLGEATNRQIADASGLKVTTVTLI